MSEPTELIDDLQLQAPPEPFVIPAWVLVVAAGGLLLLWGLIRYIRIVRARRARVQTMERAWTDALAELERLFALVDREESRPYAIESSGIIRRYIEARFELSAPRRSTEEFLHEAEHSPRLDATYQALLTEFLQVCDLLKFARTFANRAELHHLHDAAVKFVRETHQPVPPAAAAGEVAA